MYKWEPHTAPTCTICELFRSQSAGGRPKRERKNRGRPKKNILTKALQDIEEVAPPSWGPSKPLELARFLPPAADLTLSDLQCKLCRYILDRPIQMRRGKLVCMKCLEQYWQKNGGEAMETYPCPSCDNASHNTAPTPAAHVLVKVIRALLLHCSVCRDTVRLEQLNNHLKSNCTDRISAPSPSKLTVGQILCRPTDAPPTPTEKKVATSVVKRLLHTSDSEVVSLPTAGQVYTLYTISMGECIWFQPLSLARVSQARVATSWASEQTKRRRSSRLDEVRHTISGGGEAAKEQLAHELGKEGRQKMLRESNFSVELTTEESLAMKANLSLPWNKLRIMRRYRMHVYTCTECTRPQMINYANEPKPAADGLKHMEWSFPVRRGRDVSLKTFWGMTWRLRKLLSRSRCDTEEKTSVQPHWSSFLIL